MGEIDTSALDRMLAEGRSVTWTGHDTVFGPPPPVPEVTWGRSLDPPAGPPYLFTQPDGTQDVTALDNFLALGSAPTWGAPTQPKPNVLDWVPANQFDLSKLEPKPTYIQTGPWVPVSDFDASSLVEPKRSYFPSTAWEQIPSSPAQAPDLLTLPKRPRDLSNPGTRPGGGYPPTRPDGSTNLDSFNKWLVETSAEVGAQTGVPLEIELATVNSLLDKARLGEIKLSPAAIRDLEEKRNRYMGLLFHHGNDMSAEARANWELVRRGMKS